MQHSLLLILIVIVIAGPCGSLLSHAQPAEAEAKLEPFVVTGIRPLVRIAEHPVVEPRFGAAVVADGDYLYLIGGSNSEGTRLDSIERLDLRTGQSIEWAKLAIARRHHRAVVAGGKIHVLGGTSGRSPIENPLSEELSDFFGDDLPAAFATGADPAPRILGRPPDVLNAPKHAPHFATLFYEATMEVIDLQSRKVTLGPRMPVAKALFGCVVVDGKILVIGGQKQKVGTIFCTNTVELFDLGTQQWSAGINMPTARRCTAALVDGFVVVVGGYTGSRPLTTVEVFNPREQVWRLHPPLSETVNPSATVWVGNYLFLFGDQDMRKRQLVYDLRSKQLVPYPLPLPNSDFAAALAHHDKIYVAGGGDLRLRIANAGIQVFAPLVESVDPPVPVVPEK